MKGMCQFLVALLALGLFFTPVERRQIERQQAVEREAAPGDESGDRPTRAYGELRTSGQVLKRWGQKLESNEAPERRAKP